MSMQVPLIKAMTARILANGANQVIGHYNTGVGRLVKVTTELPSGSTSIKNIYYNGSGAIPSSVVCELLGRTIVYRPISGVSGVVKQVGNSEIFYPNISIERVAKY